MISLPFSTLHSNSTSPSKFTSTLIGLNQRRKLHSNIFFFNAPRFNLSSRNRIFSIKNVASDQRKQLLYHAEFTPSFSSERFDLPKGYFATSESIRDSLIINWNATCDYYQKADVKRAYYLSMEFLRGRALLNAIGTFELSGPYAEALRKLGLSLEQVAKEEPDAELGNGGLGRLASCFFDSLATLNYPAWGYRNRYKYGLLKQLITKDAQEEDA